MHEIRCPHEYIISFYIAIFNRLPYYKKGVKSIQFIIKREDEALEIAFTPSFGKNKSRKRWYFIAEKWPRLYIINVVFNSGKKQ